jgi:lipoprotein-anchoring transpeptidase ErfK/SrfK
LLAADSILMGHSQVEEPMKNRIAALLLISLMGSGAAFAQSASSNNDGNVVLVTPEGDILGYIPDASDVTVRMNKRGFRVLIDHYGNLVATEMPMAAYQNKFGNRGINPPGVNDFSGNQSAGVSSDPGYFPAPPQPEQTNGDVTGAVPQTGQQDQGFANQPLPGDGIENDNTSGDDMASLDPNEQPALEERQPDPVISLTGNKSKYEITALQVFLDREGASPGVIDGKMGLNVSKAIQSYEKISGETIDPNNIDDILTRLGYSGGLPIMEYTITSVDAAGPYVAEIPTDYLQKSALPAMGFTRITEALAERFHMDENYLKELNPGVDFTIPGTVVKVVNPGAAKAGAVAKIIADKFRKEVYAYDATGALIASYPASIGSNDTPSPSGVHTVQRVAFNPNYTYNPKINFKQGENDKVLTIPPGPNGPVGTVWIALSKPTYGIHGTPDPDKIGRTQSHGCIRLTNWDATELAKMVKPGVTVEFMD